MSCLDCMNPIKKSFSCLVTLENKAELNAGTGQGKKSIFPAIVNNCLTFRKGQKEGIMDGSCVVECGDDDVEVPGCRCSVDTLEMSGCLTVQVAVPIKGDGVLNTSEDYEEKNDNGNDDCKTESYVCCSDVICIEEVVPVCVSCPGNDDCIIPPDICPAFENIQFREIEIPQIPDKKFYAITGDVEIDITCAAP
ncbi:MAG: hypothetical protein ACOCV3_05360 [Halanaerobiales bacterium]